jgi:hypothetical protein
MDVFETLDNVIFIIMSFQKFTFQFSSLLRYKIQLQVFGETKCSYKPFTIVLSPLALLFRPHGILLVVKNSKSFSVFWHYKS